ELVLVASDLIAWTKRLGLPQVIQGVRVSHGYRASSELARIGGDFYDVFGVGERRIAFLLGDVSGKGLTAAATTMQVKSTIRALAHDGADPGEVLRRANVVLSRDLEEGQFVTAVLGVLDTTEGTVALVSAGHELPVVCSAGAADWSACPPTFRSGSNRIPCSTSSSYGSDTGRGSFSTRTASSTPHVAASPSAGNACAGSSSARVQGTRAG
ncbi:MAG: serine/threonine-protein phosphatase, partial [Coriobacteriia bacterium]|nr:serine/threonine-protein phosphatase [Coriobacteriia bacterium]